MWPPYQQTHIFVKSVEESRTDFLLLKRSRCQNKWCEQDGEISPLLPSLKPGLSSASKLKGDAAENENSLHTSFYSALLSTSSWKESLFCVSFCSVFLSKEPRGLSFLGQATIRHVVRADRWGWRGLCLPEPESRAVIFCSRQDQQVLLRGSKQISCHVFCWTRN